MTTPTTTPQRRKRRILGRILIAAVLLLLVGVLALPMLVSSERVTQQLTARVLPKISQKLGREVTLQGVVVDLFPRVEIALRGLEVAGGPGEPALLRAETGKAHPKLWPLIRSFGSDVQIAGLVIDGVQVAVVKRPDGEWSYEDLGTTDPAVSDGGSSVAWVLSNLEIRHLDVKMIDRTEKPELVLSIPGLAVEADELGFERPVVARLTGRIGSSAQNLEGEIRLDRLPESFDGLQPQQWPKLSGEATLDGMPLSVVRDYLPSGFHELVTGGAISAKLTFSSAPDGQWVAEGPATLDQLALRGKPASGKVQLRAAFPPWNPDAFSMQLDQLALQGPGIDLAGSATVGGTPLAVGFDLTGSLLDVDALLAALPPQPEAGTGGSGVEPLVSDSARQGLNEVAATGTLRIKRVVRGKLEVTDLDARTTLKGGVLRFDQASASMFGGRMDASGTQIDVRPDAPKWTLSAGLKGLDLGAAMAAVGGAAAVQGRAGGKLTLTGEGNDWQALVKTMVGQGQLLIDEGALPAIDLAAKLAGPVAQLIPGGKLGGAVEQAGQGTPLKDLTASFQVKDGWLLLTRPLNVESRFGKATLGGRIGLDQRLALEGDALLEPEFVAKLSGGRWKPGKPVDVPLTLGGTLRAPSVTSGQPKEAIRGAVEEKVKDKVQDELKSRARRALPWLRK